VEKSNFVCMSYQAAVVYAELLKEGSFENQLDNLVIPTPFEAFQEALSDTSHIKNMLNIINDGKLPK
jgi:hypothetical protein